MNTINEIFSDLKTATNPVIRAIHSGLNFKVLALGLNSKMILKDHKAHIITKLTVLNGSIIYREGLKETKLSQYDIFEIPIDITHSVEAIEDSLCLLTQG